MNNNNLYCTRCKRFINPSNLLELPTELIGFQRDPFSNTCMRCHKRKLTTYKKNVIDTGVPAKISWLNDFNCNIQYSIEPEYKKLKKLNKK